MEPCLEVDVGSRFVSGQRPADTGTNLRITKTGNVVSMFDNATSNLNSSSLNPLDNHSYTDTANVHNKVGNLPLTKDIFMEQFETCMVKEYKRRYYKKTNYKKREGL